MMRMELRELIPRSWIVNFIPVIRKIRGAGKSNPRY
jgi:hypothetical protein